MPSYKVTPDAEGGGSNGGENHHHHHHHHQKHKLVSSSTTTATAPAAQPVNGGPRIAPVVSAWAQPAAARSVPDGCYLVPLQRPDTSTSYGFDLGKTDVGEHVVVRVHEGYQCHQILCPGDEIVEVNGIETASLSHATVVRVMCRRTELELAVRRPTAGSRLSIVKRTEHVGGTPVARTPNSSMAGAVSYPAAVSSTTNGLNHSVDEETTLPGAFSTPAHHNKRALTSPLNDNIISPVRSFPDLDDSDRSRRHLSPKLQHKQQQHGLSPHPPSASSSASPRMQRRQQFHVASRSQQTVRDDDENAPEALARQVELPEAVHMSHASSSSSSQNHNHNHNQNHQAHEHQVHAHPSAMGQQRLHRPSHTPRPELPTSPRQQEDSVMAEDPVRVGHREVRLDRQPQRHNTLGFMFLCPVSTSNKRCNGAHVFSIRDPHVLAAGLRVGDHLLSVNGIDVSSMEMAVLHGVIASTPSPLTLQVEHDLAGLAQVLAEYSQQTSSPSTVRSVSLLPEARSGIGISLAGSDTDPGPVFVLQVTPNSQAELSGEVFIGDQIVSINSTQVTPGTYQPAFQALRAAEMQGAVTLTLKADPVAWMRYVSNGGLSNAAVPPELVRGNLMRVKLNHGSHSPVVPLAHTEPCVLLYKPHGDVAKTGIIVSADGACVIDKPLATQQALVARAESALVLADGGDVLGRVGPFQSEGELAKPLVFALPLGPLTEQAVPTVPVTKTTTGTLLRFRFRGRPFGFGFAGGVDTQLGGAFVTKISPGSPAYQMRLPNGDRLKVGDRIVSFSGISFLDLKQADCWEVVQRNPLGEECDLLVQRLARRAWSSLQQSSSIVRSRVPSPPGWRSSSLSSGVVYDDNEDDDDQEFDARVSGQAGVRVAPRQTQEQQVSSIGQQPRFVQPREPVLVGSGGSDGNDGGAAAHSGLALHCLQEVVVYSGGAPLGMRIAGGFGQPLGGVFVTQVDRKGHAELAGVRTGDRLVAINGKSVLCASGEEAEQAVRASGSACTLLLVHLTPQEWSGIQSTKCAMPARALRLRMLGMEATGEVMPVTLSRSGPNRSFGISIVGGKDSPLEAVVVNVSTSPAVNPGDRLLAVEDTDVSQSTRSMVMQQLSLARDSVNLVVHRLGAEQWQSLAQRMEETQPIHWVRVTQDAKGFGFGVKQDLAGKDAPFVSSVRHGGPAHAAGLSPGDRLLAVGNTQTVGMFHDEVIRLIQANQGEVMLKVQRDVPGWNQHQQSVAALSSQQWQQAQGQGQAQAQAQQVQAQRTVEGELSAQDGFDHNQPRQHHHHHSSRHGHGNHYQHHHPMPQSLSDALSHHGADLLGRIVETYIERVDGRLNFGLVGGSDSPQAGLFVAVLRPGFVGNLRVGDRLLSINGTSVLESTHDHAAHLLSSAYNNRLAITVLRFHVFQPLTDTPDHLDVHSLGHAFPISVAVRDGSLGIEFEGGAESSLGGVFVSGVNHPAHAVTTIDVEVGDRVLAIERQLTCFMSASQFRSTLYEAIEQATRDGRRLQLFVLRLSHTHLHKCFHRFEQFQRAHTSHPGSAAARTASAPVAGGVSTTAVARMDTSASTWSAPAQATTNGGTAASHASGYPQHVRVKTKKPTRIIVLQPQHGSYGFGVKGAKNGVQGKLYVKTIIPNGAAHLSGLLREGMRIHAINGIPAPMPQADAVRIIKESDQIELVVSG